MIRIDDDYSPYRDESDPVGYPGGKAKPVSQGNRTDGTPWRALLFNTIIGFFQALIVEAQGSFIVNGVPDKVGNSDLLTASKKLMREAVNPEIDSRVTANTNRSEQNEYDIGVIGQILLDLVHEAPNDGRSYARKNKGWTEVSGGGSGAGTSVEAFKFFCKQSIMFTNARIVDRRLRGWDLGLPYLNAAHEAYHFDTDINNQNQQSNITLGYSGEPPVFVGNEDQRGDLFYNPAVKETAPFEMRGRSLLGRFSISAQVAGETCGAEFWARLFDAENFTIFRLRSNVDEIVLHIGGSDPAYSAAEAEDIPYAANELDGVSYSVPGTSGNTLTHFWQGGGSESVNLEDEGIEILERAWLHIAAVSTLDLISLFIGDKKIDFERHSHTAETFDFEINEEEDEINIDELSLLSGAIPAFADFTENSEGRVPYAALDHREKWFILEAQDTAKVKTNLFETQQFKDAVLAAVNS
jgi:hypothetical protein